MLQINLKNKKVLVTGSSRGIGRAIAICMAKAGAKVAIHYHTSENAANKVYEEIDGHGILVKADLAQAMEVSSMFNEVIDQFGVLDVLVNNAGVANACSTTTDDPEWVDNWMNTLDINLNAAALLCKKSLAHFIQNGGGRIINISSRAAFRGDTEDYLAYAASKGGLVSLTKSIARSYGKRSIYAFVVAPGFVHTDMANDFIDIYGKDFLYNDLAVEQLTEPQDIAPMVAFLASGMADHATGSTFDINGGSYLH